MLQKHAPSVTKQNLLIFSMGINPYPAVGNLYAESAALTAQKMNSNTTGVHILRKMFPATIANTNESAPDSDWVVRRMTNGRRPVVPTTFLKIQTGMQHERRRLAR
jgi:hypothetical protein|tara:strand:- start:504 stop:821 length:318 start_codon:yes stop_codon:yes gene_type:complete